MKDLTKRRLEGRPLLAVEVLSPSTEHRDVGLKLRAYENAGLAWYWVIDPHVPLLRAFKLVDGRYVQDAVVTGDQSYEATEPVQVLVMPSALVS